MDNFHWPELQNGSDIRGIATEGVVGEKINLTPERVKKIAMAFIGWLMDQTHLQAEKLKVGVGCDSRISGPELMRAFMDGVVSSGATAIDCGMASTPAMFMGTVFEPIKFDGASMLTASHLPFNRNGIKFFTRSGGLDKPDITDILEKASKTDMVPDVRHTTHPSFDLMSLYADFLVTKVRNEVNHPQFPNAPLTGFHIVVDAGNGSGGFYVDKVLKPLGAMTTGSQFLNPDGRFPNHIPNPEDEPAMQFIQNAVVKNSADLGIIFDTDVDRAAAVDYQGNSINRNSLIALIAAIILEEHPRTAIVTDSITSDGLTWFIEHELHGKHHRFKRGYKNVINEALALNNSGESCWLAIETSGHAALKENYFLDDGAYLVTKILIKAAKLKMNEKQDILNLIEKLRVPEESREFRVKILSTDFKQYGSKIITDLERYVTGIPGWKIVPKNYEGIRVSCGKDFGTGWFLLRLSLHDPVIPLTIESDITGGTALIASQLYPFFQQYSELDFASITNFLTN